MNSRKKKLAAAAMLFASVFGVKKSEALDPQLNTQISKKNNLTVAPPTRKFNKDLLLKIGIPSAAVLLITGGILTWALWPKNKDAKKANPIPADTDTTSKVLGATTSDDEINGKKVQTAPKPDQNKQKNIVPNVKADEYIKSFLQKKIQNKDFFGIEQTYFESVENDFEFTDLDSFGKSIGKLEQEFDDLLTKIDNDLTDILSESNEKNSKNFQRKLDKQSIKVVIEKDVNILENAELDKVGLPRIANYERDMYYKEKIKDSFNKLKDINKKINYSKKLVSDGIIQKIIETYNNFIGDLNAQGECVKPKSIHFNNHYHETNKNIAFYFDFNSKVCKYVMNKGKNETYAEFCGKMVK